jgi:hypothetical protein
MNRIEQVAQIIYDFAIKVGVGEFTPSWKLAQEIDKLYSAIPDDLMLKQDEVTITNLYFSRDDSISEIISKVLPQIAKAQLAKFQPIIEENKRLKEENKQLRERLDWHIRKEESKQ